MPSSHRGYGTHSLPFKRPPNHRPIVHRKLRHTTPRYYLAQTDVVRIQHANDVEPPRARSLDISEKFVDEVLAHVRAEEGRVEGYCSVEVVEEKHDEGCLVWASPVSV